MQVVLWGYYGYNYGDDIMLEVLLEHFNKKGIQVKLVDLYEGRLKEKLNTKAYSNLEVIPFYKYSKKEKLKTLIVLAKSKINLWGGGTIFTDTDGDGNYKWFSLIKLFGGKIGYIGIGIGTIKRKDRIRKTKKMLNASSLTIFRDNKSLEKAKVFNNKGQYYIVEDLAYVFFNNILNSAKSNYSDSKYVLLTWRNLKNYMNFEDEQKLMDSIVSEIAIMIENHRYETVILSALDTKHDFESCQYLFQKFKEKRIPVAVDMDSSIDNVTKLIHNSSFHFSGRLHGSIASEILKVPTLTLSYSPKIQYFYESIQSKNYFDIYNEKVESKEIARILTDNDNTIPNFKDKVSQSLMNFKYLDQFLGI